MGFRKHMAGILLLILCLVLVAAAVWYLMFGTAADPSSRGGILVEQVTEREMTAQL